jgi:hypothetical protein
MKVVEAALVVMDCADAVATAFGRVIWIVSMSDLADAVTDAFISATVSALVIVIDLAEAVTLVFVKAVTPPPEMISC